eukprot:m.481395 g.481395  ORF g.481395 m.481395 type:complete len:74 (-) comp57181_c1_seq5:166-387(-)
MLREASNWARMTIPLAEARIESLIFTPSSNPLLLFAPMIPSQSLERRVSAVNPTCVRTMRAGARRPAAALSPC